MCIRDRFELVFDLPRRGLGNAEPAPKFDAGNPFLALRQVVHGAKPDLQRNFGGGENGSGDRRGLQAAGAALEAVSYTHLNTTPLRKGRR